MIYAMDLLAAMRIYVRVVERRSMSKAAEDLNMGQPAVSERINKLEKHLGVHLLRRSSRALTCTDEGLVFYERSKRLIEMAEESLADVARDQRAMRGSIRIATAQCFGETILPSVITHISNQFPDLNIDLVLNDQIVDLATEGVDISLRIGRLDEGSFVAHRLGCIQRMLVAAPSYVSHNEKIEKFDDISKHPFIRVKGIFSDGYLQLKNTEQEIENIRLNTLITTSHWRPMYELLKSGSGIGVVQGPACANAIANGELVRLLPRYSVPSFDLYALVSPVRPVPPKIRNVLDILKKHVPLALAEHMMPI